MSYNDAVEEALCYGWIDSTVRSLDETSTIQRYSPRRPGSTYSQPNKERLRWLAGENRLHPSIKAAVQSILSEKYRFPCDILEEIKKDKPAWKNYLRFPDSYRRIRIAYIDSARKRPEEFERRLKSFIAATRRNKMTGYGGIEKYYR